MFALVCNNLIMDSKYHPAWHIFMILYIDDKARQLNSLDHLTLNPKFQTQVLTILHQNLGLESHNSLFYSVSVITTFSLSHWHPSKYRGWNIAGFGNHMSLMQHCKMYIRLRPMWKLCSVLIDLRPTRNWCLNYGPFLPFHHTPSLTRPLEQCMRVFQLLIWVANAIKQTAIHQSIKVRELIKTILVFKLKVWKDH